MLMGWKNCLEAATWLRVSPGQGLPGLPAVFFPTCIVFLLTALCCVSLIQPCLLFPLCPSTSGHEGLSQPSVSTCCSTARCCSAGVAAAHWTCCL